MKKSTKFAFFGFTGVFTVAALLFAAQFLTNENSAYEKENLSFLVDPSGPDAIAWLDARYFDPETGEKVTPEKMRQIQKNLDLLPKNKSLDLMWREEGPDNIGGRTRGICIDNQNINRIWAGSVSGGLFKSENAASTWSKVETYPGSKYISSITQAANGTVVVATGSWFESWAGDGAWYTADNGETWTQVPGTDASNMNRISEVFCSRVDNKIWMATSDGLKYWNVGDAALTDINSPSGNCFALEVSGDGQVIVAAVGGSTRTYVSEDGGNTFVARFGTDPNEVGTGGGRIEYAISRERNSSGKYSIYASRTSANLVGMNVSHDNGANWEQFVGQPGANSILADMYRGQGGYNSILSVDPTDPKHVFIGGIDIWDWKQTTANPVSGGFERKSLWQANPTSPVYVHADNHEQKWDANNRFYLGNDGGVGISEDLGETFFPANRGYNVTQFYGIAFDKFGSVMGGAQDNGTVYNNHTFNTYQEFIEVGGGDGFQCAISFFNPDVIFLSSQYGNIQRTSDGGNTGGSFVPDYPGSYAGLGTGGAGSPFSFHTEMVLAEYFDPNSEDSVTFSPSRNVEANEELLIASASSGDSIKYVTPVPLYYDDTVVFEPSLTETRTLVKNRGNGQLVYLGNYTYTHIGTSSGQMPPIVDDSLLVNFPTGDDTVVVDSVGSFMWYFAQHPETNKIFELGFDTVTYNLPWDTVTIMDPYQSWYITHTNANGGELWGTRNALRFGATDAQWVQLATGIGTINAGSNGISMFNLEFSRDLEHCYVSVGSAIYRIDGLGSIYTSDPDFETKAGLSGPGVPPGNPPSATTITQIYTGGLNGFALNPNNADDLIIFPVGSNTAMRRTSNATAASPTFTSLSNIASPAPFVYDGIIDRDNEDIIVVGTSNGVVTSDDGGASWTYSSAGFEGTPVFDVRQSWRTWEEGNFRPGEIYIGTYGRGIWSSASLLGVQDNDNDMPETAFETKMTAFPNPTASSASLSFNLKTNGNATFAVYSLSGELKKTFTKNNLSAGKNQVDLGTANLSKGIYIVKMTSGNQSATTKFIKM